MVAATKKWSELLGSIPGRLRHTACIVVYDVGLSGLPGLGVEEVGLYTMKGVQSLKLYQVSRPSDVRSTIGAK